MDEVSDIKDLIISSKQVLKAEQAEIKGVKEKEEEKEEKEKAFIMTIPFDKKPVIQQDYFIHSSTIDDTRLIDPEYSQIQNKTVSNRDPSAKLTTLDLPKLDFSLPLEIDRTETKELTKPSHLDFDLSSFTEEISNIFAFL